MRTSDKAEETRSKSPPRADALPRLKLRLEDLETFLAVAEAGSFSRAAEALGLSQPSVTSRVQRLESSIGVALLRRTTRQVVVTAHGARFRSAAEATLHNMRVLLREFRGEVDAKRKRMTLAATPLLAAVALLPIIRRYTESHPGVEIRLHDIRKQQALAELTTGAADMAILAWDENYPDFSFQPLTVEECAIVTPLGHPLLAAAQVSFEEIAKFRILLPEPYRAFQGRLEAEFGKRGLPFEPMVLMNEVSNIATVIGMVAAGMGITLVPRTLISREQRGTLGVIRPSGIRVERHYGIVTARGRPLSPLARSFARFVRASIPSGEAGWAG